MLKDHTKSRDVEIARELFKEFYASCFWHWKRDLVVTEEMIPAIVKGLCTHGGRKGMLAASRLQRTEER